MIEWAKLTCEEIQELDKELPVIIPIGLIEAHGPHLSTGLDNDTAEFFSRKVAENAGAVLAPLIAYGFADEMREYMGTIGVTAETLSLIVRDISNMFCSHGFLKQIYLSGHGANRIGCELGFYKVWESYRKFKPAYWNWWTEASIPGVTHAAKKETEVAIAVGSVVHMDRVKDYIVSKPWYMINSRHELQKDSGGINGKPSQADPSEGEAMVQEIIRILSQKVIGCI